jgi:hypothetical protein
MYKLDHLRPPFNTYYYRYLLDNDSRIGRKPVVLLYNKLRPSLVARSLPGPTDLGLCTSKTFEMFASKVWQKVRSSLQHRGIKGMVTVDTTPEFLSAVVNQMPGSATRTTCCVSMYEGMHPGFIVAALMLLMKFNAAGFTHQLQHPYPELGGEKPLDSLNFLLPDRWWYWDVDAAVGRRHYVLAESLKLCLNFSSVVSLHAARTCTCCNL